MSDKVVHRYDTVCYDGIEYIHHDHWSQEYPVTCPFGVTGHTVTMAFSVETISENIQIIEDDTAGTNGTYRARGFDYNVSPGPDTNFQILGEYSASYNIRIYAITVVPSTENIGDTISFVAARNTIVGGLTVPVSSGTLLNVSPTVISNMKIGYEVSLQIGTGTIDILGECVAINATGGTITVDNVIASSYPAGTYVLLTVKRLENIKIKTDTPITFGSNTTGSSLALGGLKGTVLYKNASAVAKEITIYVEQAY